MAVIKAINNKGKASLNRCIAYVTQEEKTEKKLVSGYNCQPETAMVEMQVTKETWKKTGGRTYKHFMQSFHPDEVTPEQAHEIAQEFVEKCPTFKGFEVLIATHKDKAHIHTHLIVNSVNFEDGHKFRYSNRELQNMKNLSDQIVKKYGLKITEKGKTYEGTERKKTSTYTKEAYQLQKKAEQGKIKSYVQNIALLIMTERERATSREEFIANMQKNGVGVNWQNNHKYITFIDLERQKQGEKQCKIRDNKLTQYYNIDFSKECLKNEFEGNAKRTNQLARATEQIRTINRRAEQNNTSAGDRNKAAEIQKQTIAKPQQNFAGNAGRMEGERERMGNTENTFEQTKHEFGRIQENIASNGGGQDAIDQQAREEQQLYETFLGGIEEITREVSDFTKQVAGVGEQQRDINHQQQEQRTTAQELGGKMDGAAENQQNIRGKQRSLGTDQQHIGGRVGELGERIRETIENTINRRMGGRSR